MVFALLPVCLAQGSGTFIHLFALHSCAFTATVSSCDRLLPRLISHIGELSRALSLALWLTHTYTYTHTPIPTLSDSHSIHVLSFVSMVLFFLTPPPPNRGCLPLAPSSAPFRHHLTIFVQPPSSTRVCCAVPSSPGGDGITLPTCPPCTFFPFPGLQLTSPPPSTGTDPLGSGSSSRLRTKVL